jgi:Beta-lactamase
VVVAAACVDKAGTGIAVSPGDAPADGRFEIGSVAKTMTAALLALLPADGALSLDDELGRWLSAGPNGGITLRQLATHTSGLPRLAPTMDLSTVDPANPYAGFGFERAEEGLRQATAAAGGPWLYSNFGYHLLGLVLERASGQSYQALLLGRPGRRGSRPRGRDARQQRRRLLDGARPGGAAGPRRRRPAPGPAAAARTRMGGPRPRGRPAAARRAGRGRPRPWLGHVPGHVSAERVERAWRTRTQDLGPAGRVRVHCHGSSGHVVADVTIAFAHDAVAVRIGFEPSGQLDGLRVLPPPLSEAER